jgi:hypothetical protein
MVIFKTKKKQYHSYNKRRPAKSFKKNIPGGARLSKKRRERGSKSVGILPPGRSRELRTAAGKVIPAIEKAKKAIENINIEVDELMTYAAHFSEAHTEMIPEMIQEIESKVPYEVTMTYREMSVISNEQALLFTQMTTISRKLYQMTNGAITELRVAKFALEKYGNEENTGKVNHVMVNSIINKTQSALLKVRKASMFVKHLKSHLKEMFADSDAAHKWLRNTQRTVTLADPELGPVDFETPAAMGARAQANTIKWRTLSQAGRAFVSAKVAERDIINALHAIQQFIPRQGLGMVIRGGPMRQRSLRRPDGWRTLPVD